MNRNWLWLILAALVAGSMLTTMVGKAEHSEARARWEYRALEMRTFSSPDQHKEVEAKLNELGKQGWELVDWEDFTYLLKRPAWD